MNLKVRNLPDKLILILDFDQLFLCIINLPLLLIDLVLVPIDELLEILIHLLSMLLSLLLLLHTHIEKLLHLHTCMKSSFLVALKVCFENMKIMKLR